MKKIIVLNTLLFSSLVWCQINTETLRGDHATPGISQNLNLSFAYISGTSKIIFLNASYRLDYTAKSNWYGFFETKYERAFDKESQEKFSNRGFGHLRAVRQVASNIQVEGFLQKEFNYFIDLENRELIGGGFRFNPFKQFFIANSSVFQSPL